MFKAPFSFDGRIRRIEYFLSGIIGGIVFGVAYSLGLATLFLGAAAGSAGGSLFGILIGIVAGRLRKRGDFIDQQLIGLRKCATKKLAGFFFAFYS